MISAIAEWKAVKEIFPQLEITSSPYGDTATLKLKGWELRSVSQRLGQDCLGGRDAIRH
jgi:hypothetical protein